MNFTCNTVEERDRSGNLTMIGVEWSEARAFLEPMMEKTGGVSAIMSIPVICMGMSTGNVGTGLLGIVGLICGLALLVYVWCEMEGTSRSILFSRDGAIKSPLGFDDERADWDGTWHHPHAQITSIEAEQLKPPKPDGSTGYTHGARIIMRDGFVSHFAKNLEPDQAHMVAVRLTNALLLMRSSVGTTAGPRRGEVDVLIN